MVNEKWFTVAGEPAVVTAARKKILGEFQDLEFYPEGHRYVLHDKTLPSVSNVTHCFIREPFNEQLQAKRYAEKRGQTAEYWIQQWRQNSFRATTLGTKTHAYGESLGYLRAGMPERICPSMQRQYMPQYGFLAPIHPKEEAVLKFMNEMPNSMHLVLIDAYLYVPAALSLDCLFHRLNKIGYLTVKPELVFVPPELRLAKLFVKNAIAVH